MPKVRKTPLVDSRDRRVAILNHWSTTRTGAGDFTYRHWQPLMNWTRVFKWKTNAGLGESDLLKTRGEHQAPLLTPGRTWGPEATPTSDP